MPMDQHGLQQSPVGQRFIGGWSALQAKLGYLKGYKWPPGLDLLTPDQVKKQCIPLKASYLYTYGERGKDLVHNLLIPASREFRDSCGYAAK